MNEGLVMVSYPTRPTSCPDASIWRVLFDGDLSDAEQTELSEHLTHCEACRERLESLSAEDEQYLKWKGRGHHGRLRREDSLVQLMDSLRRRSRIASEHMDPSDRDAVRLDFLQPSA